MMRRLVSRVGVAVVVAAVVVGLSGPADPAAAQLADEAWAIGLAANYYGNMDFVDNAVYGVMISSICTGWGIALSISMFGPLGMAGFGAACSFGTLA